MTAAERRRAERAMLRQERRLLRAVRRLQGCLPALERTQRRVLVLRSGVGPAHRHSRATVARRLDIGVGRVMRLERRGVRTLRALDRATDCAPGAGPAPAAQGAAGLAGAGPPAAGGGSLVLVSTTTGSGSGSGNGGSQAGSGSGGAGGGSPDDEGGVAGLTASNPPALVGPPAAGPGGGFDPSPVIVAILIALALGVAARVTIREMWR